MSTIKTFADFIIKGSDGQINISKELFDDENTITFNVDSDKVTEVSGDWSTTLIKSYSDFATLRRDMNYYFFVKGIMKPDVKDFVEVKKEDGLDFNDLFDMCETLGDSSMAYFASYFVDIKLKFGSFGMHTFPLVFLRHYTGTYYSTFIETLLENSGDDIVPDILTAKQFDAEFYYEFCALRTRLNGKMFDSDKCLNKDTIDFLDTIDTAVISNAIVFADAIRDCVSINTYHGTEAVNFSKLEFNDCACVCGAYLAIFLKSTNDFPSIKEAVEHYATVPTKLYRDKDTSDDAADNATDSVLDDAIAVAAT